MFLLGKSGAKGSRGSVWPFMSKGIHDRARGRRWGRRIATERRNWDKASR